MACAAAQLARAHFENRDTVVAVFPEILDLQRVVEDAYTTLLV